MESKNRYDLKEYEPLWGSWQVGELIGEGSYGKVYRVYKNEWDLRLESALKTITVPSREQLKEARITIGQDQEKLEKYCLEITKNIINEIRLLYKLRGNSNIVSYEDHAVEKRKQEIAWDILIRMEYVQPLTTITAQRKMRKEEVIKLGIDICTALETCLKHQIVHRDIKEENIFISFDGNFKLGDFGIAREMSKGEGAASVRGTPVYLAPEVFRGGRYDHRSDLYSLGIVLYKLMNHGRYPFMPSFPNEIKYSDSEAALIRKLSGETLPLPQEAKDKLGRIINKACAFRPEDRYDSASTMKRELQDMFADTNEKNDDWLIDLEDGSILSNKEIKIQSFNNAERKNTESNKKTSEIRIEGDWLYL
ncbi:MAG: serine/threonine protein kinase [Clostridia bacterium]|nr:serine/threonine protein kinase [Clostridia bacterium]